MSVEIKRYGNPIKIVNDSIDKINKTLANAVVTKAKQLVAVDTGALKSSIKENNITEKNTTEVGSAEDYAVYVEYGTRRQGAQPFLEPAILGVFKSQEAAHIISKISNEEMSKKLRRG